MERWFLRSLLSLIVFLPAQMAQASLQWNCTSAFSDLDNFAGLDEVPWVPTNWRMLTVTVEEVGIKNTRRLFELRQLEDGTWVKVYRRFRDGRELHYFLHEQSGAVVQVKYK